MPLKQYGVLKARPIEMSLSPDAAHLEIHLKADGQDYRIALNVRSQAIPAELRYIIHKDFVHPFSNNLIGLKEGITSKEDNPAIALDYVRGNLFNYMKMKLAPEISAGDNELSDTVQLYVERAIREQDAMIYAFGEFWGPDKPDQYFGFTPGQGIHDIHMNQGNAGRWGRDNGTFQDGGMLIYFPAEKQWTAFFFAFQSQSFHTDDNGNVLDVELDDENAVYIISALLNAEQGNPFITILNRTNRDVAINSWKLVNQKHTEVPLSGTLKPAQYQNIEVAPEDGFMIGDGGIITLMDDEGLKIHGVSYTRPDYAKKGYMKVF